MAGNYQELFRLDSNLYSEGSPVLIEAGALLKNISTNQVLAQLKFRNISSDPIEGCKISIGAYELNGNKLDGVENFSYLDLHCYAGNNFGSKIPVYLPNNITRKFDVAVTEIIFLDGEIWRGENKKWEKISSPRTLLSVYSDKEVVKQYEIEVGSNATYYPEIRQGLFYCTCGAINKCEQDNVCYKCKRKYDNLVKALDKDTLIIRRDNRLREEQEQEEAQRKKAKEEIRKKKEKKEKTIKTLMVVVPVITILIIVVMLIPTVIKPAVDKAVAYNNAKDLLESGLYDEARNSFELLGSYRDSEIMVKESTYEKAKNYLVNKQYDEAIAAFNEVSGYLDADDMVNEVTYCKADDYYSQKKYDDAIELWETIINYSDSKNRIAETDTEKKSDETWLESEYDKGLELIVEGNYLEAITLLEGINSYKDSTEKINSAKFEYISNHKNDPDQQSLDFLEDLIECDYPGAKELYEYINEWKVINVFFNSNVESGIKATWFTFSDPICCHFKVSGPIGETSNIYYTVFYPNGSTDEKQMIDQVKCGEELTVGWPRGILSKTGDEKSGTLSIEFYDDEGNLIGTGSVMIK